MFSWIMLLLQATLAVLGLELLRHALRYVGKQVSPSRITLDVLLPVAIVFPLALQAVRIENSVSGFGWLPIGGPVTCGLIAVAFSLIIGRTIVSKDNHPQTFSILVWLATGFVLLMLSAANELTIPVGQCIFAVATIVLWLNTPTDISEVDVHHNNHEGSNAYNWVFGIGIAQAVVALFIKSDLAQISSTILIVYALMALAIIAALGGPRHVVRVGGWVACYGVLISIGLLTLMQLVPMAREVYASGDGTKFMHVATDFWKFAPEGVILMAIAGFSILQKRMPLHSHKGWGASIMVISIAWCVWKLSLIPTG